MWLTCPILDTESIHLPFFWQEHLTFFYGTTLLILCCREGCSSWSSALSSSNQILFVPEWGNGRKNLLEPTDSAEAHWPAGTDFCYLNPLSFTVSSFCPSSVLETFLVFWDTSKTYQIRLSLPVLFCWYNQRSSKGHEILTCGWCFSWFWVGAVV